MLIIFFALLIICFDSTSFGQDTLRINDESVDQISLYDARDSILTDAIEKKVHLYGDATVETEGINLTAGYIVVDIENNEVTATHLYDEDSNRIETPVFTDGAEKIEAYTLKYNLDTKKAYIEEVKIVQDEMILYMGEAKRQSDETVHFENGRFTTCELPNPHYHFQLSRAVMVPEKRIVSGPMSLHIEGVPTPFGLPFSYIPQQEDRSHGIIFPEIVPLSAYGSGLNDIGYYFPINDYLQTTVYAKLYTRGSWGLRSATEYAKRYKYKGNFDLGFEQFKRNFPDESKQNKLSFQWNHKKDKKSNPYWNFNTRVNFISNNQTKANLDPANGDYFKNTLQSDININRSFPGKPYRMSGKISLSQNSQSKNISLNAPTLNFSTSQFFPLKNFVKGPQGWKKLAKRFGVIYSIEGRNNSTFKDTLLRDSNYEEIGNQFFNGVKQNLKLQTTGGLFQNILKITPSVSYESAVNFQQVNKSYDAGTNSTVTDTLHQAGYAHRLSFSANATTLLYSYYRFIGKSQPKLRHILTPRVGFAYSPAINETITDSVGVNMQEITYSPFERSLYRYGAAKDRGQITFSLNNTFELKRKSEKDTVTGFQKIRIIDALSINGNYDLLADSMNLSNIQVNLRISPFKWLNFVAGSTVSPYNWVDSTGQTLSDYAVNSRGTLGRTLNNRFSTTLTLSSKEGLKKVEENKDKVNTLWDADFNYFYLHPEYLVDFDIPWKVSFSHNYNLIRNQNKSTFNPDEFRTNHTLLTNGDISITKRWKLSGTINTQLKDIKVTNGTFTLNRDMHCWALSFRWTPIGTNKSFLLTIRNTSSLFKDAKLDFRKPPAFF